MKAGIVIAVSIIIAVLIISLGVELGKAQPAIPQQAQASHLAVPSPEYKYQSAVVIYSCRLLTGIVFVDAHGDLHPVDPDLLRKMTAAQALTLLSQAPAENELGIQTLCNNDGMKT